ncbi:MAG TPA: phosphate signaling complex protein PhoU [Anaerolineaceae bacterium]|nr:phosphate signaling complex protein PhoU [Chloroflexota bacterium]HNY84662.1 phosphate signaling complex protein PhoU [Anaerolineaceae bacterium]
MPRYGLDRELRLIQDETLILGSMVEQAMLNSIDALRRRDAIAAQEVIADDHRINDKRYAIENRILILFATHAPLAHDMRVLAATLEVTTEIERIGDYAKGIAKVAVKLADDETPIPMREIQTMADIAVSMLHRALGAFVSEDLVSAHALPAEDDKVDELYNLIYKRIIQTMVNNPSGIEHSNQVLWVIHNLERTADRVTNICERIVYMVTGELMELESSEEDATE